MHSLGYRRRYSLVENGTLALATALSSLMTGVLWTYSFHFGQAMLRVDGDVFFQVLNTLHHFTRQFEYSVLFFGTAIMLMTAVLANVRCCNSASFFFMVIGAIIYFFGVIYFTQQISRPLTFTIDTWGSETLPNNWQETRKKWIYANQFRFYAAFATTACCLLAFVFRANLAPKESFS